MSGYVYILSNPAFPHLIKIGKSDRDPIEFRTNELYSTGVPYPFTVEYFALVDNHHFIEAECHRLLAEFRPNKGREFFEYPIPEAIALIRRIAPVMRGQQVNYKTAEEIRAAEIRYKNEQQEKARIKENQRIEREREDKRRIEKREKIQSLRTQYTNEMLSETEWIPSVLVLVFGPSTLLMVIIGFGDSVIWPFVLVAIMWSVYMWANALRTQSAESKAIDRYPYDQLPHLRCHSADFRSGRDGLFISWAS